jgi:uncharacterized protein (DUF2336 family)
MTINKTHDGDTEMQALLDLARDKSVDGRTRLVEIVGDLFFGGRRVLTDIERGLMTEILRRLINDVELSVRKALAERLAREPDAPAELIQILANDEIDVAHDILEQSNVLQDIELIEIIQHRTFEHQLTIAMRKSVSEPVSDSLVETGNTNVIRTLIENPAARISDGTMEILVGESKNQESYQEPLLGRPDLSPHLAKRMYWWVSAALRKHIVEQFKVDPAELDQKIESTIKDILNEGGEGEIDTRSLNQADMLSRKLAASNAITPQLLLQTLRKGEVTMFENMFAQLTGLRVKLVRRLVFEPGGEGLSIACKAVKMNKPNFGSMFLLSRSARPGDKSVDPNEVNRAMKFFDRINEGSAKKVLARWKLDPDYLYAIKQVDGEAGDAPGLRAAAAAG